MKVADDDSTERQDRIDELSAALKRREGAGKNPRVDQCYICRAWQLEKNLFPIEVPDQGAAWVEKKCCQSCLDKLQSSANPD